MFVPDAGPPVFNNCCSAIKSAGCPSCMCVIHEEYLFEGRVTHDFSSGLLALTETIYMIQATAFFLLYRARSGVALW